MRLVAGLALVLALAGCGGAGGGHGTATLWVTRDRGAHVLFTGTVPAGLTAIQALERRLQVTTRYGGRYVQSIDGIQGTLSGERDWFFFVNGIESGVGAAEVVLHPGDVEWWDYRSWANGAMSVPVVAAAWPEPFLHAGPTKVVGPPSLAHALAAQVRAGAGPARSLVTIGRVSPQATRIRRRGSGFELDLGLAVARRLAHDPAALRFRY